MINTMVYTDCDFCNELNGIDNLYWEVAKRCDLPKNRMVYEGENWVIWPTIGAIVPGYVLIVSKRHRLSIMDCNREEIVELDWLIKRIRSILENIYHYPCIAFEHGGGCGLEGKPSCIDHCHLHVLPLKEDIYYRMNTKKMQISVEPIKSLSIMQNGERQHSPYLLYQNHEEQFFVMHANIYISQYFRQLIALSEGVSEKWNWRYHFFSENIKATINDINKVINGNLLAC